MKKLIIAILIILLASNAFAFNWGQNTPTGRIKVFQVTNSTGAFVGKAVPTSLIGPGTKILGVSVIAAASGGSDMCGIWDTVANGSTTTIETLAEVEKTDNTNGTIWFPYPLTVTTSITINQGANTIITIYYE